MKVITNKSRAMTEKCYASLSLAVMSIRIRTLSLIGKLKELCYLATWLLLTEQRGSVKEAEGAHQCGPQKTLEWVEKI